MTVNVPLPVTDAIAAVDAWFEGLGRHYLGRLPAEDPFLAGRGIAGWKIATKGHELLITVDAAFPFSRPNCYLPAMACAMPHIDRRGKLCLRNPELPGDPVRAVSQAVGHARSLLAGIAAGAQDDDFQEDFGLYWADGCGGIPARLLGLRGTPSTFGAWAVSNAAYYGFPSRADGERWWKHRFGQNKAKIHRMAIIALDGLPHPDSYPRTATDLWEFVERRSGIGEAMLRECLEQCPKALLVTLTGMAPSGRGHAASLLLSRKLDAKKVPLKRRAIVGAPGIRNASVERLLEGFDLRRLATQALDAASSRLPYAEQDQLARSRVAVIGCGALGSGVARLLAKSGIGQLVLVDPDTMAWENIRRHQLGAGFVGLNKAKALAHAITQENPDITSVESHGVGIQTALAQDPSLLTKVHLVVGCTANWAANAALDNHMSVHGGPPSIYAWMEAHALASHAVLVTPDKLFASGYDDAGTPPMTASISHRPPPAECGGLTTPFGAVELAHAENRAGSVCLNSLRAVAKWISALVMPQPGLAAAR